MDEHRARTLQTARSAPDVGNILKPTLDALVGPSGLLVDDWQVQEIAGRWIDHASNEQNMTVQIRFLPTSGSKSVSLVFVEVGKKLCLTINADLCREGLGELVDHWEQVFSKRGKLIREGVDPYIANSVLPMPRPFLWVLAQLLSCHSRLTMYSAKQLW